MEKMKKDMSPEELQKLREELQKIHNDGVDVCFDCLTAKPKRLSCGHCDSCPDSICFWGDHCCKCHSCIYGYSCGMGMDD